MPGIGEGGPGALAIREIARSLRASTAAKAVYCAMQDAAGMLSVGASDPSAPPFDTLDPSSFPSLAETIEGGEVTAADPGLCRALQAEHASILPWRVGDGVIGIMLVVHSAKTGDVAPLPGLSEKARAAIFSLMRPGSLPALDNWPLRPAVDLVAVRGQDAVVELDLDCRVTRWSAGAERLTGWKPEQVLGRTVPGFPASQRVKALKSLRRASIEGWLEQHEVLLPMAGQGMVPMRVVSSPLVDPEGRVAGVMGLLRPAAAAGSDHAPALEALGRELKDHLTGVSGFAQLLGRPEIPVGSEAQSKAARSCAARANAASAILDDMLLLMEAQSGLELQKEVADIASLVSRATSRFNDETASGSSLIVEMDASVGSALLDTLSVERALARMLDACARSGRETRLCVLRDGDEVVFEVDSVDDGDGCPASHDLRLGVCSAVAHAHGGSTQFDEERLVLRLPLREGVTSLGPARTEVPGA